MIFKRAIAKLRAQDWTAISIEIVIVVIGVFLGMQVSNWNDERLQKRETNRMLTQLVPQLQQMEGYFRSARTYFATTRNYAAIAEAGWRRDPKVSDNDFVIAAYQASQIQGIGTNGDAFASVLGVDQLREIDDEQVRTDLSFLMTADYSQIDIAAVNTPYRQNVRRMIPSEAQDAIRASCGDRASDQVSNGVMLPPTCGLRLPPHLASSTAALLRAHPELADDLHWHTAAAASMLTNLGAFETVTKDLQSRLAKQR